MEPNRKHWNERHKLLTGRLASSAPPSQETPALMLEHHASVHGADVGQSGGWSYEDGLWSGMTEAVFRFLPDDSNPIAWHVWHLTRIEDLTMNILVADREQILFREPWLERMNTKVRDTGNAMSKDEVRSISDELDMDGLRAYRTAVGQETQRILQESDPGVWKHKVQSSRLDRIRSEGGVLPKAEWLLQYWGGKKLAGLYLMPATRHHVVHLNQCMRIKEKAAKQLQLT